MLAPDDEECRRLLAPSVATSILRCVEAVEEAIDERLLRSRLEPLGKRIHGFRRGEDVSLRRVALPGAMAGLVVAGVSGVGGGEAVAVDDAELPLGAVLVRRRQALDDLVGRQPFP